MDISQKTRENRLRLAATRDGYLCYVTVHHLNHHANPRHDTYLYWAKRRHALHHYCGETNNFGIITDFWDRLFGTEYPY